MKGLLGVGFVFALSLGISISGLATPRNAGPVNSRSSTEPKARVLGGSEKSMSHGQRPAPVIRGESATTPSPSSAKGTEVPSKAQKGDSERVNWAPFKGNKLPELKAITDAAGGLKGVEMLARQMVELQLGNLTDVLPAVARARSIFMSEEAIKTLFGGSRQAAERALEKFLLTFLRDPRGASREAETLFTFLKSDGEQAVEQAKGLLVLNDIYTTSFNSHSTDQSLVRALDLADAEFGGLVEQKFVKALAEDAGKSARDPEVQKEVKKAMEVFISTSATAAKLGKRDR